MDAETIRTVLGKCFASDGKSVPIEDEFRNISKIVSEQYMDANKCRMKIYIYSIGKTGNNKPYEYSRLITDEQFMEFKQSVIRERTHQDNKEEDPWK
jgi:hypothetical protein